MKSSLQNTLDNLVETPETKTILDAAVSALENAIAAANATKTPYAAAKALITFVTAEMNNSTGTKTGIEAAINTATTNIETRTEVADLEEDYNTLESARQIYVTGGAQPTSGNVFDYTFKIANAAVTMSTTATGVKTHTYLTSLSSTYPKNVNNFGIGTETGGGFPDGQWSNTSTGRVFYAGGTSGYGAVCGAFARRVDDAASYSVWNRRGRCALRKSVIERASA